MLRSADPFKLGATRPIWHGVGVDEKKRVIPPAVIEIQALVAERGAIDVPTLASELRERRRPVAEDRLPSIIDRYPELFALDTLGRIVPTVTASATDDDHPGSSPVDGWWRFPASDAPLDRHTVVVLDIETTGLEIGADELTEVAVVGLDGAPWMNWCAKDGPLADALDDLGAAFAKADAVVGHNLHRFDLPFLAAAARKTGKDLTVPPTILDTHQLSMLVDPTLDGRSLAALCDRFEIINSAPHTAVGDARATAALTEALIARIDPSAASWTLALRLLGHGQLGWDRMVPGAAALDSLAGCLQARADPLVEGRDTEADHRPSRAAIPDGFALHGATVDGYTPRPSQLEMAEAVGDALATEGQLLVEAPTGTGKSLAYLIPAAWRASRAATPVVIATHTKVLQRQLRDDAEGLRASGVLTAPFRQVLGVENYVCPRNVAEAIDADEPDTDWFAIAVAVRALAEAPNGVWDDITDGLVARSDLRYRRQRARLRATAATCERRACAYVDQCPLYERLKGIDGHAGVIATNHAMVAQWAKSSAAGIALPGRIFGDRPTALVVDEAHTLEDSLTSAWATGTGGLALTVLRATLFGRHGVVRMARDAARGGLTSSDTVAALTQLDSDLGDAISALGDAVADYLHDYGGRGRTTELRPAVIRGRPLHRDIQARCARLAALLGLVQARLISLLGDHGESTDEDAGPRLVIVLRRRILGAVETITEIRSALDELREPSETFAFVHVLSGPDPLEGGEPSEEWDYARIPIEIGPLYRTCLAPMAASVVHTSATLRVKQSFDFIGQRLGLRVTDAGSLVGSDSPDAIPATSLVVDSPFDHDEQSAVVLTSHLPLPLPVSQEEFCEELGADQVGFLSLTGGRQLGLFAARARMNEVARVVREHAGPLAERGVDVLVQGDDSPARIQQRFREEPGTTVYGVRSYWEGFDAPGETLSYLLIEKAPYPHPDDIVARARQRAVQDRGGDPFLDYVVPLTSIALTQGFGRLIRRTGDRGVAVIADRRMQQPSAANGILLQSLPTSRLHHAVDRDDAWRFAIEFVTGEEPDLTKALLVASDRLAELLESLRLAPGEDPEPKLRRAALEIFDIAEVRDDQMQIMRALLDDRDVLGFLPTGAGKSLTFQLPALLHPEGLPTIVVSPLIALIKDQVDELRGRRGIRAIAGITGRTSAAERTETMRDLAEGKIRLLYVSPERLVRDPTLRQSIARQNLGALVVDEAHCVSSWGHDFRPEFRQIASAVRTFRRSPRLALTATATREVEGDISETLLLDDPVVVRRPVDRPDLSYWVRREARDADRTRELLRLIAHMGGRPGIVYASRRALTEELAWLIREAGVSCRAYHAGMIPEQREAVQDDFLAGTTQVIVATKAFGMGVNKPDIGWVVHYDLPESLEAYAQEAGRAARSPGLRGLCVLFFTGGDLARRRNHLRRAAGGEHQRAEALLAEIRRAPQRGKEHVVDPDALSEDMGLETDELNVVLAWLERAGAVERDHDCSARARVSAGVREPDDPEERRRFIKIVKHQLGCRIGADRLVDIDAAAETAGMDADSFEAMLIDWSLRRLVTFSTTQRRWRIRVVDRLDPGRLHSVVRRWQQLEKRRLEEMIGYATGSTCRRTAILRAFGDADGACTKGVEECDVHAGSAPPWHAVPLHQVLDPETLVDVDTIVLQAVRWSAGYTGGRYGEVGLKAALCGKESLGEGRPLNGGLLSCPQFGALRYLRSNEKRVDASISSLITHGLIVREAVEGRGRSYTSLALSAAGRDHLEGV